MTTNVEQSAIQEITLEELAEQQLKKREHLVVPEEKNILGGMFQNAGIEVTDPSKLKANHEYSLMQWSELQAMARDCHGMLGEIGRTYLAVNQTSMYFTNMGYVMTPEAANASKVIGEDVVMMTEKYTAITNRFQGRIGTFITDDDLEEVSHIFTELQLLSGEIKDMGNNLLTLTAEVALMRVWYAEVEKKHLEELKSKGESEITDVEVISPTVH